MTSNIEKTELVKSVDLRNASDEELNRISREGMLSLTLDEMKTIQAHYQSINREPTDAELETIAQTWSEHCYHKTFKGQFTYSEMNLNGQKSLAGTGTRNYENLFKETIAKATHDLNQPWCLSVFKDNAGVIAFDDEDAVCFKVETHNHPSALEPYGGAGTGLGGVIRDVLGCGLGAKPVMNTDVFCFGPLDAGQKNKNELPEGALTPKRIAKGVISGVRDYGNRMGIPTSNGAVYFDSGYVGNPLVFCGTVGLMPNDTINKMVQPGDLVVAVGGKTGRDGVHGATFSSAPLEKGITSSVVQIGHAIVEKKFMDVLLVARNKKLYRSTTDCGAGGFSSAIGELGSETGVKVQLEKAPLKYEGLAPWEIWVSESQERMVLAVPPENWNTLKTLFQLENIEATVLGEFTNDKRLHVTYHDQVIIDLDMNFLHNGTP
ncbi:MAG: AIR synthase-related protein, partial [Elusimicrobiota bacterium]